MDYALGQAQLDSSFRPDARLWYNIIVTRLTDRFDYPFYRKSADGTFLVGQKSYALPSDFKRADFCYQTNENGNQGAMIPIVDNYLFEQMNGGSISGPSSVAKIDTAGDLIVFNTSVGSSGSTNGYRLFYFKKPTQVNTDGSNDAAVPDFDDQNTLMEELKAEAFEFRDDQRYGQKKQEAKDSLVQYQRNQYNDDSYSVVPLNAITFRGTNRRTKSRGFRNG